MKKVLLPALLSCFAVSMNVLAADVNCDFTPYYGVCPVCETEVVPTTTVNEEVLGNSPADSPINCDVTPYFNGVCDNA